MKKTFTINLAGIIFHIDEDAYEKLQDYLSEINSRFANIDEGKEIIADVEIRLVELFQEKLTSSKQVVTIEDINEVISIMGMPEDFGDDENDEPEGKREKIKSKFGKRIYRDVDNRILGGVCSGLGAFFGIDPLIVRVAFIIGFFLSSPLIYLILWIILPKAETTAQKLEMQGENINVSNIEKKIKEEFNDVKKNFRKMKKSQQYHESRDALSEVIHAIGRIIIFTFRVVFAIVGISFAIAGVVLLIAIISSFFYNESFLFFNGGMFNYGFPDILAVFAGSSNITLFLASLFVIIALPILGIIWVGIKLVFKIESRNRILGIFGFLTWIIALGVFIVVLIDHGKNYAVKGTSVKIEQIQEFNGDVLYLKINESSTEISDDFKVQLGDINLVPDSNNFILYGEPTLDIEASETDKFKVFYRYSARGLSKKAASRNSEKITYNSIQKDTIMIFDPYFTLNKGEQYRFHDLKITVKVPIGKMIYMDDSMYRIIYNIKNVTNTYDQHMLVKRWMMGHEGLTLYTEE